MMQRRIGLCLSVLGVGLALLVVHTASVRAEGISLTTSPVVLNLAIQPGTSDSRTLQLMNNSSQPVTIDMAVDVFSAKGDTGEAVITEPQKNDPSVSWLSFSPSSFVAKPGVWSSVKMTINLPKSASLGYYYAVLFKPRIADQPSANTTIVHGTNAVLVLVDTHSTNETHNLSVDGFTVSQGLYEYLPATFDLSVHNNGNIYTAPVGNIYISRNSDLTNSIAALDINPGQGNVLPHGTRNYHVQWTDGFPVFQNKEVNGQVVYDDHGNPVQQLSWSFAKLSKVRIGKYYAQVTLIYNDNGRIIPITREVSFWVIPWKIMLITLVVVVVLIVGLTTIGRSTFRLVRHHPRIYRR